MDLAHYVVELRHREGLSVSQICHLTGKHRSWIYKILDRYAKDGETGITPRSKRPQTSPNQTSPTIEDEILWIRKTLSDDGYDAGPTTIHWHLNNKHGESPSLTTIWRVLKRHGFITPQPQKRPKSSYIRFQASLPNECWQSDFTHWHLADETHVEILNFIDDHSRYILTSKAIKVTTAHEVLKTYRQCAKTHGQPASLLTDNGAVYTGKYRHGQVALETELAQHGIQLKHGRPYHPQTQGKIERWHQTLKNWLNKQPPAQTIQQLQEQLNKFVHYYNTQRPHRALNHTTPQQAYKQLPKAQPNPNQQTHYKIRYSKVDNHGKTTLRHGTKLHHIGIGRPYKGTPIIMLIANTNIRILNQNGELLRQLTLNPDTNYQKQ